MTTKTIKISEARIGMRLAEDIVDHYGRKLLTRGKILTPTLYAKLRLHRVRELTIGSEDEAISAQARRERLRQRIEQSSTYLEQVMEEFGAGHEVDYLEIEQIVAPMIFEEDHDFRLLELMSSLQDRHNYTYNHGVAVSAFASVIAKWLELDEESIFQLAMAGYLHDVGKAKIPPEVLDKPGELTELEWKSMRKHPEYAYKWLVQMPEVSKKVALAIYEHHERCDGSGYPRGLLGEEISLFGRIIAVCDVFHALVTDRSYKDALSPFLAIRQIEAMSPRKLDPRPVKALSSGMVNLYRGQKVLLSNSQYGRIVHIDPTNPSRPIVLTENGAIDLGTRPELFVQRLI